MWTCGWVNDTPPGYGGPITSTVRVLQPYQGGNFAWVDGHAKSMNLGAITAGTDFATSTTSDGPTQYGTTGCVVTNLETYLWSLDGTLDDVK
jgi:prepilin-type processing-associated H-X9-DG protein